MKLLVGLGNYPDEYTENRHNVGFLFLDFLVKKFDLEPFKSEKKFFGQVSTGIIQNEKVILIKPETYMNLSGKAVAAITNFYKLSLEDMVLFYDDIDLDFGIIRLREKGRSGGHKGVQSLIENLGSQDIIRIKFGIANEDRERIPTEKFVLQNFRTTEKEALPKLFADASEKLLAHLGEC